MSRLGLRSSNRVRTVALAAALTAGLAPRSAAASPAGDELVRQARAHEEAHEEDVAARRYTEALTIDPTNGGAWLGLGELRRRLGEFAEAERVYAAARLRIPSLYLALEGRARCLWALGRHADAETNLQAYADVTGDIEAYRALAGWFGADGRSPAELAVWRRLLALAAIAAIAASAGANDHPDGALWTEARLMVRSLVVLADGADPASSPADPDPTRRELAQIARAPR